MSPRATSVLHDLLYALVVQVGKHDIELSVDWRGASAEASRAGVYAAIVALCERRVIENYSTMHDVWPPGVVAFWPRPARSLWKHGDDVLRSCVRMLVAVDGAAAVDEALREPLLRALDAEQKSASLLLVGHPEPGCDAERLDRIAEEAERVRAEMPAPLRGVPDPALDPDGFAREFSKASKAWEEERLRKAAAVAEKERPRSDAAAACIDAKWDVALAKIEDLSASRVASAVADLASQHEARVASAVAAAVAAVASEHEARVADMRAELARMRDFDTQVLQDNRRLREEKALLFAR